MKIFLSLFLFAALTYKGQSQTKVDCTPLQISFSFPPEFKSLNNEELDKLAKRGEKAIKEEFDNDKILGWQPGCLNLRDSLKRVILMNHFSVKEAINQDGSVNKFIDRVFDDSNEFLIRRLETKSGLSYKKSDVVNQSTITIAGYQVRKNALTLKKDNAVLIQSRYYFFEKNGQLYFLSFTAGRANDNLQIEKAIESAVKM